VIAVMIKDNYEVTFKDVIDDERMCFRRADSPSIK